MTKTITLNKYEPKSDLAINKFGLHKSAYVLFEGEQKRRRMGWTRKEIKPLLVLIYPQKSKGCYSCELILEGKNTYGYTSIWPIYKSEQIDNAQLITGESLLDVHKIFSLVNYSNKIPLETNYFGGGLLGDVMSVKTFGSMYCDFVGHYKNKFPLIGRDYFLEEDYPKRARLNPYKYLSGKTGLSKWTIQNIMYNSYPDNLEDDNKTTIEKNDLVKIVLNG